MQAFWHFMAIYGILAFLPKSRIGNQIRFFRFFPIFRLFPTSRLSDSTALVKILYDHYIKASNDELLWLRLFEKPFFWQVQLLRHPGQRDCLDGAGWLGGEGRARLRPGWLPRDSDHVLPISHCSSSMFIRTFTFCSDS